MVDVDTLKIKVQRIIASVSLVLLVGKFLALWLTNSVGILTDAMESIVNVVAGFVSLYSLHQAAKPKDEAHPFGHGKVELISASLEGILILIAGLMIIYEGVRRLFHPALVEKLDIGIVIIALAGVVNWVMGWYSVRLGKRYDSIALVAGGKHLQSDTYSTIGLVAGLILLYVTKIGWIDSALALIFGTIIVLTGIGILKKTIANLMDKADRNTLQTVLDTVSRHRRPDWINIHNTKIIKYGSHYYVDCDLTLPWYYSVRQAHVSYNQLKAAIAEEFANRVLFSVHVDPCDYCCCSHCGVENCPYRKAPFVSRLPLTMEELTQSDE